MPKHVDPTGIMSVTGSGSSWYVTMPTAVGPGATMVIAGPFASQALATVFTKTPL
jgi:hypothetical protein